ncbi:MAG: OmpH family outer membrane protein [Planctomycetota bacterium]
MKNKPLIAVSMLAALLAVVLVGRESVALNTAVPTSSFGVVDMQRLLGGNQFFEQGQLRVRAMAQELEAEGRQRQQTIAALRQQLESLKPGTPEFRTKQEEVLGAQLDFQSWQQLQQIRLQTEEAQMILDTRRRILDAISEVADQQGLQAVLTIDPANPSGLDQLNPQQLVEVILTAKVPYRSDQVDVTDDVIAKIDANFQGAGGEAPAGPELPEGE